MSTAMQRLLQTSINMYKASLQSTLSSNSASIYQQPGGIALGRHYSILSLKHWLNDSISSSTQIPTSVCSHRSTNSTTSIQAWQSRSMSKLTPKFIGGKLKPYSSYKERFRTTATGLIMYKRPGHRHKRFSKGPHRNRQLRRTQVLTNVYTATMQRLGFVSRRF